MSVRRDVAEQALDVLEVERARAERAEIKVARMAPVVEAAVVWFNTMPTIWIPDETDHGIARSELRAAVTEYEEEK